MEVGKTAQLNPLMDVVAPTVTSDVDDPDTPVQVVVSVISPVVESEPLTAAVGTDTSSGGQKSEVDQSANDDTEGIEIGESYEDIKSLDTPVDSSAIEIDDDVENAETSRVLY